MKYQIIYADPPWKYGSWGVGSNRSCFAKKHNITAVPLPYPTMSLKDICTLPVKGLADDNCELYLWTTQKYLPSAFLVLKEWGFHYCQTLTWCKAPRGLGQGGIFCPTTEFLLLGRRGKMPHFRRLDSTWYQVKRPHNSHSTKPEFFQDMIEQVSNPPRLELFARRKRLGWDCIGNDIDGVDIREALNRRTQE